MVASMSEVGTPVELGDRVEELSGLRVGGEGISKVLGEVVALRALWLEDDLDGVASGEPAVATPGRSEHQSAAVVERFDHAANTHAVDCPVDVVCGLAAPDDVGIEWHRHEHAAPVVGDEHRGESP